MLTPKICELYKIIKEIEGVDVQFINKSRSRINLEIIRLKTILREKCKKKYSRQ